MPLLIGRYFVQSGLPLPSMRGHSLCTMLSFLARDKTNAQAISKLKRKAQCSAPSRKTKAILLCHPTSATQNKTIPGLPVVAKFISSVPVSSVEASSSKSQPFNLEEIIQCVLPAGQFSDFESYSASLAEKVPVNPTVETTMRQLLLDVELKFGQKMPKSK